MKQFLDRRAVGSFFHLLPKEIYCTFGDYWVSRCFFPHCSGKTALRNCSICLRLKIPLHPSIHSSISTPWPILWSLWYMGCFSCPGANCKKYIRIKRWKRHSFCGQKAKKVTNSSPDLACPCPRWTPWGGLTFLGSNIDLHPTLCAVCPRITVYSVARSTESTSTDEIILLTFVPI